MAFSSKTEIVDPATLYDSLKPIIDPNDDSGLEPIFRFHPSEDANTLSWIFSGVETVINPKDYMRRRRRRSLSGAGTDQCEAAPVTNEKVPPTKCQNSWRVSDSAVGAEIEFTCSSPVKIEPTTWTLASPRAEDHGVAAKDGTFSVGPKVVTAISRADHRVDVVRHSKAGQVSRRFVASGLETSQLQAPSGPPRFQGDRRLRHPRNPRRTFLCSAPSPRNSGEAAGRDGP